MPVQRHRREKDFLGVRVHTNGQAVLLKPSPNPPLAVARGRGSGMEEWSLHGFKRLICRQSNMLSRLEAKVR